MLEVRRREQIYHKEGGWFSAYWHFSFDEYYDPHNMGVGTLRVFNHDTLIAGAIWPMHPHRDVEGITYVVAGEFEHADDLGNGGVLLPGGVQRMRLGSGAWHSERNHSKTRPMQFIQMWILPSERGLTPGVEQRQYAEEDRHNRLLRFLRPEWEDGEGVGVYQDVSMYASRLDPGAELQHRFEPGRGGYFYLIGGEVLLNGERLTTGDAAKVLAAGDLRIQGRGREPAEFLFVDTPL